MKKMVERCLILFTVIAMCAGAVWYVSKEPKRTHENAVLASLEKGCKNLCGKKYMRVCRK